VTWQRLALGLAVWAALVFLILWWWAHTRGEAVAEWHADGRLTCPRCAGLLARATNGPPEVQVDGMSLCRCGTWVRVP
jgi:hypothetical protein